MEFNPFSLAGKTILVTGAASGMGRATAIACSKMGAHVIAIVHDPNDIDQTLSELEGTYHQAFPLDLSNEESWCALLTADFVLDGIANCAGIASMNPFAFIKKEEFDKVFGVNLFGPVLLVKSLLKKKKLNKGASVVFVSSIDGPRIVHPGNSVYSASKNALVGIARNMAIDLASKKIRVNCILPGTTDTPLIRTSNVTEEELQENAKLFPLKRFGTPEEMAYAIIYLLSDASSFVTGTELVVDGGYSLL